MVMSAMVQLISWGKRLNVLFNEAKPSWVEHFIFHRMKIAVPSYEWETFIIFYITSKNICCHLEHLINLGLLENAILFWSRLKRLWICQFLTREDAASSTGAILPTSLVLCFCNCYIHLGRKTQYDIYQC